MAATITSQAFYNAVGPSGAMQWSMKAVPFFSLIQKTKCKFPLDFSSFFLWLLSHWLKDTGRVAKMVHTIKQSDPKGMHFIWFTPTSCSRAESQRPYKQSTDVDILPVRSKTEGVDEDLAVNVDEGLQGGHVHLAEDIAKLVILILKDFNIFRIFLK